MTDHIGQQIGNYRLIYLLGKGSFTEIYLGEHIFLKTKAAIKVFQTQLAGHGIEGFLNEARTIANLVHPNIIRILEFGLEGTTPFLIMDYAPNGTLRKLHPKGMCLPLTTVVSYIKQISPALQYAHAQNVIHRDIKPENLLLGRANEVLLSDFGIALVAQTSNHQLTQQAVGTVAYMAPEQIQGKPSQASDQYSLGIVVYEWLSGALPFSGSDFEMYGQHLHVPPIPLREKVPGIPPLVEQVVMTAFAKDPKQRFGSVQAFAKAFEQASQSGFEATFLPTKPTVAPAAAIVQPQQAAKVATVPVQSLPPPELFNPSRQMSLPTEIAPAAATVQPQWAAELTPVPVQPLIPTELPNPLRQMPLPTEVAPAATVQPQWAAELAPVPVQLLTPTEPSNPLRQMSLPTELITPASQIAIPTEVAFESSSSLVGTNANSSQRRSLGAEYTVNKLPPPQRGISRRTILLGLAGLAVVGVAGGSIALLAHTQFPTEIPSNAAITSSGAMFGFDLQHTRFNPDERILSPTNVSHLMPDWTATIGANITSSPAVINGVVYIGSSDHKLYAFKAATGQPLWTAATGASITSSPAVANGVVYVGSDDHKLYAFNVATGQTLWTAATDASITSSPAVANGVVYVGSGDHKLYAFNVATGQPLWTAATGANIFSSPAVANGVVYVGSDDQKLYAFKATTGQPLWTAATRDRIFSSPAVANGVVYIGSWDKMLYAFNATTGQPLWMTTVGASISSSPTVASGVVYVGAGDGKLYAFHLPFGSGDDKLFGLALFSH